MSGFERMIQTHTPTPTVRFCLPEPKRCIWTKQPRHHATVGSLTLASPCIRWSASHITQRSPPIEPNSGPRPLASDDHGDGDGSLCESMNLAGGTIFTTCAGLLGAAEVLTLKPPSLVRGKDADDPILSIVCLGGRLIDKMEIDNPCRQWAHRTSENSRRHTIFCLKFDISGKDLWAFTLLKDEIPC